MLIVDLFGFLNIKSVKIYAIPYIFATTLLVYKLDTLLLKQKKRPVLDITGFFFRISTQVKTERQGRHPSTNAENETRYIQYGQILLFH